MLTMLGVARMFGICQGLFRHNFLWLSVFGLGFFLATHDCVNDGAGKCTADSGSYEPATFGCKYLFTEHRAFDFEFHFVPKTRPCRMKSHGRYSRYLSHWHRTGGKRKQNDRGRRSEVGSLRSEVV